MNSTLSYKNLYDLTGKTAIVTGGCGILGEHFCKALSEFGANVAIVDINITKANQLAALIEAEYGTKASGLYCDVSQPDSTADMVKEVIATFGHIDILHNNAASKSTDLKKFFADFEDYSPEEWKKIMAVNVDGMFLVAKEVGKHMVERNIRGSIIQTSSIYGLLSSDKRIYEGSHYLGTRISNPAVYSASKSAVIGLTRYLAAYWGDKGIRVNALIPGGVESGQNDIFKEKYSLRVPLGRMAQAYEMTGALIFLSSEASSYVTGQCIVVDGGLSAW
jgi:NAD(P)-dependent dehydrogenase (short-subunit alcohol dehydrogenase family)